MIQRKWYGFDFYLFGRYVGTYGFSQYAIITRRFIVNWSHWRQPLIAFIVNGRHIYLGRRRPKS